MMKAELKKEQALEMYLK
jgi:hypothetical protein